MKWQQHLGTGIVMALFLTPVSGKATPVATRPAEMEVDPAALVRQWWQSEAWIGECETFFLQTESTFVTPPEIIEQRKKELAERRPAGEALPENFPSLKAQLSDSFTAAFDQQRLYLRWVMPEVNTFQLQVYDGELMRSRAETASGDAIRRTWTIRDDLADAMPAQSFMMHVAWPQSGVSHLWWPDADTAGLVGGFQPEDFAYAGREPFRGVDCHVLRLDSLSYHRWYVGVEDGRLYGSVSQALPQTATEQAEVAAIEAAEVIGVNVEDFEEWYKGAEDAAKDAWLEAYNDRIEPLLVPETIEWMTDYREIAPSCFVPMVQGYEKYSVTDGEHRLRCAGTSALWRCG